MNNNDLIKIDQKKILDSSQGKRTKSPLLTLALIRNDISDLVYLQGLFAENVNVKSEVSSEMGQSTGRIIYIMRIALSYYYEFLYFLNERKKN